jgi:hypothetical protein
MASRRRGAWRAYRIADRRHKIFDGDRAATFGYAGIRWDAPDQRASRIFGDEWYDDKRSTVLIVPSAIARVERNIVINQEHLGFRKFRATAPKPVVWDERLFR